MVPVPAGRAVTSVKKRILLVVGAVGLVTVGVVVVALAVGSRLTFSRIENLSMADGAIQVQVAEGSGTTTAGLDHNVFVVGSGLVFETGRIYGVSLYASGDCSGDGQPVGPWSPDNSQVRTLRGSAPPGSRLSSYASAGVTSGEPPELLLCSGL